MDKLLDTQKLADMVKSKRGKTGLRTIAEEIGISASTLSRIEQGNLPDVETFIILCRWLNVSTEYFTNDNPQEKSPQEQFLAHLRADRTLPESTARALMEMIKISYAQFNTTSHGS